MSFDPRTISTPVYAALNELRSQYASDKTRLQTQKSQAVEIYTYLSTWGMMRFKAEELALSSEKMAGKKDVVRAYFTCLQTLSGIDNLAGSNGLSTIKNLNSDRYLGLTGLGLELAQEFSFWANAVYHNVESDANS